jgi:hypothetical protein
MRSGESKRRACCGRLKLTIAKPHCRFADAVPVFRLALRAPIGTMFFRVETTRRHARGAIT